MSTKKTIQKKKVVARKRARISVKRDAIPTIEKDCGCHGHREQDEPQVDLEATAYHRGYREAIMELEKRCEPMAMFNEVVDDLRRLDSNIDGLQKALLERQNHRARLQAKARGLAEIIKGQIDFPA